MKIAILGGGFAGLTAAYHLRKKGYEVIVFERDTILGGLAAGFKAPGWDWPLERAYHHWFANDYDILNFAKEIGFTGILPTSPETTSLYKYKNNYRTFPVDTPQGVLTFPLMSLPARLRTLFVLAFFKLTPLLPLYHTMAAAQFLRTYAGKEGWQVFFEPLFRKKFGKYAEKIVTSFIWTRIHKRTKQLIYAQGGFQTFVDHLEKTIHEVGVDIRKGVTVEKVEKSKDTFTITYHLNEVEKTTKETFDIVISTLPTSIMSKITAKLLPETYLNRFKKLEYMHAVNLILETEEPITKTAYWSSICVPELPFMVVVQHTNMIDKKHYGGKHVAYIGNYVDGDSELLKMNKEETLKLFVPHLEAIAGHKLTINQSFHFKAGFAQPIFNATFVKNKPDFITPVKGFYIANLDMTYPQDRGTNYAVALGKKVAELVG